MVVPAICLTNTIVGMAIVVHCTIGVKVNCTMAHDYCAEYQSCHLEIISLMPEFGAVAQDQGEFWLAQSKYVNLIAFKVIERLYGFT